MSSLKHQQDSATEQSRSATQLSFPDTGAQQAAVEQLAFPEYSPVADNPHTPIPSAKTSPGTELVPQTQALFNPTRELTEVKTDAFSKTSLLPTTTSMRQPVLIRGTGRKSVSLRPPASRRRPVMHVFVTVVLALVVLSALFAVVPVGKDGQSSLLKSIFGSTNNHMNMIGVKGDNAPLIAQQAATATAVTTDGYDAGSQTYAGVPTAPPSTGGGGGIGIGTTGFDRFFYGQCTYWANMRYYQLTGHQVAWIGNAYEWEAGAVSAGWVVSSTPHVPSIIVLQPGVQLAGGYGHVAVVESILRPGVAHTSNWNWAGYWGTTTYVDFTYPMSGVSFVWHP